MSWHEGVNGPHPPEREDKSTPDHGMRRYKPLEPISAVSDVQRKRDDHQSGPEDEVTIDAGGGADLMIISGDATSMLDDDREPMNLQEKKSLFSNDCDNITTNTNVFIPPPSSQTNTAKHSSSPFITSKNFF